LIIGLSFRLFASATDALGAGWLADRFYSVADHVIRHDGFHEAFEEMG
jgi:hypothetical protein